MFDALNYFLNVVKCNPVKTSNSYNSNTHLKFALKRILT